MATYVPRVLVCGNVEAFRKKIGDKPVEVVGLINFSELENLELGAAEYLIFTDDLEFYNYRKKFPSNRQIMSVDSFTKVKSDGFYSHEILKALGIVFGKEKFSGHMLDLDCFFVKSGFHTLTGFKVDCLAENLYPIYENLYGKIYRTFDEFKFHHFDAIVLSKERSPEEFIDVLIETDALTEKIFAFVRKNSALESWLAANQNIFAQVKVFETANGAWCLIEKIMPPADVGVYVVTHKDAKLSALPEGYKIIHAGKILGNDLGYLGDDTGDNISRLNPFLDEVTALYWVWKNTNHTHAGFCHYRRFLTSDEKILSATEIVNFLRDYDIILPEETFTERNQVDMTILSVGQPALVRIAEKIIRNHLAKAHPDYLDAFDDIINGFVFFGRGIFVMRRNILEAYCRWLFSFIIDALQEMRTKIIIGDKTLDDLPHAYSRVGGFFAERMLTVWLMKNHLRIKTLPVLFLKDV